MFSCSTCPQEVQRGFSFPAFSAMRCAFVEEVDEKLTFWRAGFVQKVSPVRSGPGLAVLVQRREVHVRFRVGNSLGLAVLAIGICRGSKPPGVGQTHSFHGNSFEQDWIAQLPPGYCLAWRGNLGPRCKIS